MKRLVSSAGAKTAKSQHTEPCSDCPWARTALPGWLGGDSVDAWLFTAHHDHVVPCHTLKGAQCAGIAIYRRNVCKEARPPMLKLERDLIKVFASPVEFRTHHSRLPS
jgi:hypothetical protein